MSLRLTIGAGIGMIPIVLVEYYVLYDYFTKLLSLRRQLKYRCGTEEVSKFNFSALICI
jgi:hypothetical protein